MRNAPTGRSSSLGLHAAVVPRVDLEEDAESVDVVGGLLGPGLVVVPGVDVEPVLAASFSFPCLGWQSKELQLGLPKLLNDLLGRESFPCHDLLPSLPIVYHFAAGLG